jgi:hypothetical protein
MFALPVSTFRNDKRNGSHNDLPYDDPAFKWAWEIYKEADHLVHIRTTFFFRRSMISSCSLFHLRR